MSNQSGHGNLLLKALKTLGIAILRVIALLFAWCCKIIGFVFTKLSELTFKLADK
jgi:hypothetical protein